MKVLSLGALLVIIASCGPVQDYCYNNGYPEACYTALGDKVEDGKDGVDGKDGADGKDGKDGESCTVVETIAGALVSCGPNRIEIKDGEDAVQSPYAVEELIDPCGDYPDHQDEIIIRTYNGDLIAYFQDGSKRFLTALEPGDYRTTDKQKCRFRVTEDFEVQEI